MATNATIKIADGWLTCMVRGVRLETVVNGLYLVSGIIVFFYEKQTKKLKRVFLFTIHFQNCWVQVRYPGIVMQLDPFESKINNSFTFYEDMNSSFMYSRNRKHALYRSAQLMKNFCLNYQVITIFLQFLVEWHFYY